MGRVMPDERNGAGQGQGQRGKHPIREFAPVHGLDGAKILRIHEFPGSKDVYFNGPDRAGKIEGERQVEEEKDFCGVTR